MGIGQALTMPLFFESTALCPLGVMTGWLRAASCMRPLSYEVDALRGRLTGSPAHLLTDVTVLVVAAVVTTAVTRPAGALSGNIWARLETVSPSSRDLQRQRFGCGGSGTGVHDRGRRHCGMTGARCPGRRRSRRRRHIRVQHLEGEVLAAAVLLSGSARPHFYGTSATAGVPQSAGATRSGRGPAPARGRHS